MDPFIDPLAIRLLGEIRQQELMEQAAKGQQETRRLVRRLSPQQFDVWQAGDSALTSFYSEDGLPPFYRLRAFVTMLLLRVSGRAKRLTASGIAPQDAQVLTEPQCISEC